MCIFSKLCFGLQFTLIAFLFHFPQRHPSQIASLFSLKFLSLLRELASWISAPPSVHCAFDSRTVRLVTSGFTWLQGMLFFDLRRCEKGLGAIPSSWSELRDGLKVLDTVTDRWHLIPFSLQGCSPTHFPSHAFPIQGFADGLPLPGAQCLLCILAALSQVLCTSPLRPKLHALYIFLWLCYGCCPIYQTTCAGCSDELLRSTFRIKGYYCPHCWKCNLFGPESTEERSPVPHTPCPTALRPHSLSMIDLHGGVKVWLSHLSGDRSEKSPLFGTPCGAGSGFPWGCFIFWLHQRMLSPANLPSLHGCYS